MQAFGEQMVGYRPPIKTDLLDAEEAYSGLFDQGRALSLHLFEHLHGESRDRGQAMVDLMQVYEDKGPLLDQRELPDFIPLFVEFLGRLPHLDAREWLADMSPILARLGARLQERQSPYSNPFAALLMICGQSALMEQERASIAGEQRDDTADVLDREWEESAVTFSGADSCDTSGNRKDQQRNKQQAISVAVAAISDVHILYKLHVFFGLTIVLVFPFTRLVHMISAPIWYLGRRYQIVRGKSAW